MTVTALVDDLRAVRSYVEAHDWIKGRNVKRVRSGDAAGGYVVVGCCLYGAIGQVLWAYSPSPVPVLPMERRRRLRIALLAQMTAVSLTYFNDFVAESKQDVLDLIDRAIEAAT